MGVSHTPPTSCLCQHLRQTFGPPLPNRASSPTDICAVFFLNSKQVRLLSVVFIPPLDPVFLPDVLSPVLCHPSASPLSVTQHISHCATMNSLPILPHTGHMSLERIYYTISLFRKSCKEASRGDEALEAKSRFCLGDLK